MDGLCILYILDTWKYMFSTSKQHSHTVSWIWNCVTLISVHRFPLKTKVHFIICCIHRDQLYIWTSIFSNTANAIKAMEYNFIKTDAIYFLQFLLYPLLFSVWQMYTQVCVEYSFQNQQKKCFLITLIGFFLRPFTFGHSVVLF